MTKGRKTKYINNPNPITSFPTSDWRETKISDGIKSMRPNDVKPNDDCKQMPVGFASSLIKSITWSIGETATSPAYKIIQPENKIVFGHDATPAFKIATASMHNIPYEDEDTKSFYLAMMNLDMTNIDKKLLETLFKESQNMG